MDNLNQFMNNTIKFSVDENNSGKRLDVYLTENINHLTRVMTTAIALETSKGNLTFALALGIILILISLCVNFLLVGLRLKASLVDGKKL